MPPLLGCLGLNGVQSVLELAFGLPILTVQGLAPVARRKFAVLGDVVHPVPFLATPDAGTE
eukprot:9365972-Lingulodinium_polyedra.AAC.1